MPRAVFSFTNNTVDKEYSLVDFKQLIRSGNNTIRMNCGWTYCYGGRSRSLTLLTITSDIGIARYVIKSLIIQVLNDAKRIDVIFCKVIN